MQTPKAEYSARVEIWLEVRDQCLSVRQVGNNSLILRGRCLLDESQTGRIIIDVDGLEHVYPVVIRENDGQTVFFGRCQPQEAEHDEMLF